MQNLRFAERKSDLFSYTYGVLYLARGASDLAPL
jgi:hypothetical protein